MSTEIIRSIRFGTDGVRGVIDRDFNELVVASVAYAALKYFKRKRDLGRVLVSYDTRRKSDIYARIIVETCKRFNIETSIVSRPTPTPVVSWTVREYKYDLAFQVTASHNPPEYNGVKVIDYNGCSISDEDAEEIMNILQKESNEVSRFVLTLQPSTAPDVVIDPRESYIEYVVSSVSSPGRRLRVLFDPLYGTTIGYTDEILRRLGHEVKCIHYEFRQDFGGVEPCPEGPNLENVLKIVKENNLDVGISHDGDGDRIGVVTGRGRVLTGNEVLLLFVYEYAKNRKIRTVARTVATTSLVDKICRDYNIKVIETPVGIKYIAELLIRGEADIGGEESGGVAFRWHVPEKDGIYTAAQICDIESREGVDNVLDEIYQRYGVPRFRKHKIKVEDDPRELFSKYKDDIVRALRDSNLCIDIVTIDGVKCVLQDGSWVLVRPSGTEPVIRIYGEEYSANNVFESVVKIVENIIRC
ncbi:MAG: phosphoglucomutase/phosphomannomutase family protein [Crenarchaeota archaeon]|nr:phosphoglucomutase/phosphomannomutase family protein [Thermoproteota archaeon]